MLPTTAATTAFTTPFVDCVAHLYTPDAFKPPPGTGPVPASPQDWVSFNALDASGPATFAEFRETALFDLARRQLLDRLDDCRRFALAHCSPEETRIILDGMASFRNRLEDPTEAERYYGENMALLFGSGKRSFETFCLRLHQSDLDLHQRKTVLRELAQQLPLCGSAGPAFRQAALALDQAPGGLRAEFYEQLMLQLDSLLKQFVCTDPSTDDTLEARLERQQWRESMEVHMVNRLKLDLDLPGADPEDRFARSPTLIKPEQRKECSDMLRRQLRPVVLAKELAERYQSRLRAALPAALQSDPAGLDDLMAEISDAHTQLNATFGPVPLHHVLEHDEQTGRTQWRGDLSLIALDLLHELERQGLVVPRPPTPLMSARSLDCEWDLVHIDWRLFVVMERFGPQGAAIPASAQLHHASRWRATRTFESPRSDLTRTVLAAESPDGLMALPHDWLKNQAQCEAFLRRVGEERALTWLRTVPGGSALLRLLLPALTDLGMGRGLALLKARNPQITLPQWVALAGGGRILQRALVQPEPRVFEIWSDIVARSLLTMTENEANATFSPPDVPPLVDTALRRATAPQLDRLLGMLYTLRLNGTIGNAELVKHLWTKVQLVMFEGRLAALQTFGHRLAEMARNRWLSSSELRSLIEGSVSGTGCSAALENGQADVVRWFHSLVATLRDRRHLSLSHATSLVGSDSKRYLPGALLAIHYRRDAALREHLAGMLAHFSTVPSHAAALLPLMNCRGVNGSPGLRFMLDDAGEHPCLDVWRQAVLQASEKQLLTAADVACLVSAMNTRGVPYIRELMNLKPNEGSARRWLETVRWFQQRQAIGVAEVDILLEAVTPPQERGPHPMLHSALSNWRDAAASRYCAQLYSWAYEFGVIGVERMVELLMGMSRTDPPLAGLAVAISAQRHDAVAGYLAVILEIAARHNFPAQTVLQLLDARTDSTPSVLTTAVQLNRAAAVRMLLWASLRAAQDGLLPADTWCAQMMPADGHLGAIDVLGDCRDPEVHEAISDAMQHAQDAGILNSKYGSALLGMWRMTRRAVIPIPPVPPASPASGTPEPDASSAPAALPPPS